MKKLLALLLAVAMTFSLVACGGESVSQGEVDNTSSSSSSEESSESTEPVENQVIVGDVTQLNGDFMEGWTNIASNACIKSLIYGYGTVILTQEGKWDVDPQVVTNYETTENEDGSKTYTFEIAQDLTYNDGTPITAKDYVFSLLLSSSPEFGELEADNTAGVNLVGFENFNAGHMVNEEGLAVDADGNAIQAWEEVTDEEGNTSTQMGEITGEAVPCKTFSGVRLLGDYSFSVTIKAEELPYFYELTLASVGPMPYSVIAPGVEITDDGNGATLSDEFTTDLIRETLVDETNGYRYKPAVTCGAYSFESYDANSSTAVIVRNEKFKGIYDGTKPSIDKIIVKLVEEATQVDELEAGTVDLIPQISGGDRINAGLDLVDKGLAAYSNYPRFGYGKIAFACNFGPTQFPAVRQAVAWLLDRDEFARQYTGGYGVVVDSNYGASQWEYQENKDALESNLTHYTLNVDKAKEILIADGWTLNENGEDFVEGTDTLRYKKVGNELMPLTIQWASTGNSVADLISTMLLPEAEKVGMQIVATNMDFNVLISHYYQQVDPKVYHMFNMGTGFADVSAFWYYYDPQFNGLYNTNFIDDEELLKLATELKTTDPEDTAGWSEKWVQFQERWNYLMPDIPLYSDDYHDFYNAKIENYESSPQWRWESAIIRASIKGAQ